MELPNGLHIENVRHIPSIKINLIALADLEPYKPEYLWETREFLLHIDDMKTIRVPMSNRLWPIHFEAIPTPRPRTPKQSATATATANTTATTATTTATTATTTTAATAATTTTAATAATKTKAKGRALPIETWHKRLGHLNYADVKQLATYSSQIKLANTKESFCEPCIYGKQHAIPNHEPQTRAKAMFDLIHIDLGGGRTTLPIANSRMLIFDDDITPTPKGAKLFMIITDDYSRYRWFFTLKHKSDAAKVLKDWIAIIKI